MTMNPILSAALLSLIAGLGTGLGGLIAVIRRPGRRSFGFLMGITAGVMITLSFLELVHEAWQLQGFLPTTVGFGLGAVFMFTLDVLLPHIHFGEREIPPRDRGSEESKKMDCGCESAAVEPRSGGSAGASAEMKWDGHRREHGHAPPRRLNHSLLQSGLLLAAGITIHNLPEGFAVGAGYAHTPAFGMMIALAILLHNIPEGIATALPLCRAGMSRTRSLLVALLSGMAEPIGALAAVAFLGSFHALIPGSLAFAGGVMMFITLDELIPTAREHGHQHYSALGIIAGAIFVFLLSGFLGI